MRRITILALIALVSCERLDPAPVAGAMVSFSAIEEGQTKATSSQDSKINGFQLLVFNREGNLEAYGYSAHGEDALVGVPDQRELNCYAVVNVPRSLKDLSEISSRAELLSQVSFLKDNGLTSVQMIGSITKPFSDKEAVAIPVSRLASKITVAEIKRNMKTASYKSLQFKIMDIYVTNVNVSCPYSAVATEATASLWLNQMGYKVSGCDNMLWDGSLNAELAEGKTYSTRHSFYVYPNPSKSNAQAGIFSPRYTRLVVKASLGGHIYYYVVNVKADGPDGTLEHNTEYTLRLEITGPGSTNEDELTSNVTSGPGVSVSSWVSSPSVNESF